MASTITKIEIKQVVRESVREAVAIELMKLRALLVPSVSKQEQRDIEKRYRKPSRRIAKTIKLPV